MVTYTGGVNVGPNPVPGGGKAEVDVSAAVTVDSERDACLHGWRTNRFREFIAVRGACVTRL